MHAYCVLPALRSHLAKRNTEQGELRLALIFLTGSLLSVNCMSFVCHWRLPIQLGSLLAVLANRLLGARSFNCAKWLLVAGKAQ